MKSSLFKNVFTFVALVCLNSLQTLANTGPTFYYSITAQAQPTGYGKVYAEDKEVDIADEDYQNKKGTGVRKKSSDMQVNAVTVTAYLYAKPEDGYIFTHWARVNMNTGAEDIFSWSKYTTDIFTVSSGHTTPDTARDVYYYAHFSKVGKVYPESSDEGLGTVTIDIPDNKIGDEVTITALPDQLTGRFLGWSFGNSSNLITQNPYTIKVTEQNSGTYTAVFESKEISTKGVYCYIRNKSTKRTLGVTGSQEGVIDNDHREFKHSMMAVPSNSGRIHAIPANVIKVVGQSTKTGGLKGVEMISQGVSTFSFSGSLFKVEKRHDGVYYIFGEHGGFTGYIKDWGGTTRTYEFIGKVRTPSLYNRGVDNEEESQWYIDIIDEDNIDENYFGAMPEANCTKKGKYYTTMYTAFPYKCMDGVKAYTVDRLTDTGMPHLKMIENDIVPANTAVVLECKSTIAKENRLLPLTEDVDPIPGKNMLKGEIWLDDASGEEANYRTLFDPSYMRILGNDAKFSNINLTDPVSGKVLTYIANNTCYLDLSGEENIPDVLDFTTTGNVLKGDVDGNGLINVTDVTVAINYILNKPVTTFIFENADAKEDQVINMSDVTAIINIILQK